MKSRNVNIVLILSLVSALCMFYLKFQRHPEPIDKIRQGISGINPYIRPETVIGLKTISPDIQLEINIAYILAPVPVHFGMRDTTLFLLPFNATDTNTLLLLRQRAIIWQNKDDQYQYIFARTR